MWTNKSIILVLALGIGLVLTLFSLPKVVVNNKKATTANNVTKSDTTSKPSEAKKGEASHEQMGKLTPSQQNQVNDLLKKYSSANTDDTKINALSSLSMFYYGLKKFDSAAVYSEKATLLKSTEAYILKTADLYFDAYNFATNEQKQNALGIKTREYYQKAIDKNPNLLGAKANMAMTYVSTPNPMQGIMLLREVLATDPTNELALFNLGMLSMRSNQYAKAAERFKQLVSTNPKNSKAAFYLGVSLLQLGKKEEAKTILAKVKVTEKDPAIQSAIRELEQELK